MGSSTSVLSVRKQFTPEYIQYILLSDEAKGLQELWEPDLGDHVRDVNGDLVIVVGTAKAGGLWVLDLMDEEGTIYDAHSSMVAWLPTLRDLLQVVEGAGYDVLYEGWTEDGERRHSFTAARPAEAKPSWSEAFIDVGWETDRMLAAARLAVRAIGGKS
jgi:hypothetical protein